MISNRVQWTLRGQKGRLPALGTRNISHRVLFGSLSIKDLRKYFAFFFVFFAGLVLAGCSLFADKRVPVKPKIDTTSPEYKEMLRTIIYYRYDSEILRSIEADKEYEKYLKEKDKPWDCLKCHK